MGKRMKITKREASWMNFLTELTKGKNWAPVLTQISKKTNVPVSTVCDRYHKIKHRLKVTVELKNELGK